MKKYLLPVGVVAIIVIVIVVLVLSISAMNKVDALSGQFTDYKAEASTILSITAESIISMVDKTVDTLSTHVADLYVHVANVQVISMKNDSLMNEQIGLLKKKVNILEKRTTLCSRQINDIDQLVFELAYGKGDSVGMALYAKYQKCGNQALWDSAMVKLTPKVTEKLQRIAEIDAKLTELEKRPVPVAEVKKADLDKISKRVSTLEKTSTPTKTSTKK